MSGDDEGLPTPEDRRPPSVRDARQAALAMGTKRYTLTSGALSEQVWLHDPTYEELCLPPYGFVECSEAERAVYDHPALQRLRRVAQLGGASLVFPAAEHSRFPHSLGVLAAATDLMDSLDANVRLHARIPQPDAAWRLGEAMSNEERTLVRLAALMHDVAHLPFGHTLEDELELFTPHDSKDKIRKVARFTAWAPVRAELPPAGPQSDRLLTGPTLEQLIQDLYAPVAAAACRESRPVSVLDIVLDLVARDARPHHHRYRPERFRVALCREILVGAVSADVLDYLPRDQAAAGVQTGSYNPRLLQYLLPLIPPESGANPESQTRLVIDLGQHRRVKTDAVTAVHGLLASRFEMTQIVYRHPVKSACAAMLDRVFGHFTQVGVLTDIERTAIENECYATFADEDHALRIIAKHVLAGVERQVAAGALVRERKSIDEGVLELLDLIALRRLHKVELALSPAHERELFEDSIDGYSGEDGVRGRTLLARRLEIDFGLHPGDVVIYSSGPRPGLKDPDLWLRLDGDAVALLDVAGSHTQLARRVYSVVGEYFRAQQARFTSLGRFELLLSNAAVAQLESMGLRTIFAQVAVLALKPWTPARSADLRMVLSEKVNLELGRLNPLFPPESSAARSATEAGNWATYPNGMPALAGSDIAGSEDLDGGGHTGPDGQ